MNEAMTKIEQKYVFERAFESKPEQGFCRVVDFRLKKE